ncbi:MAG TPA: nucleoside phosphorylase [Chloroflexaceae bacterium]|nr:nucleoside phosphorylase [Chloroflexaceae bacterium]
MSDETPRREPPILAEKHYAAPSVFDVANLMREARRQKGLPTGEVPPICVLDPDGDLVDYLRASGQARQHPAWACYHTALDVFTLAGVELGIIGRAVGASFAVLIAEELFVSGCRLLISVTSAGQVTPLGPTPYFVLIEQALRDEGTSYHYLPPGRYSALAPTLGKLLTTGWDQVRVPCYVCSSWTTDAPFRETAQAIAAAQAEGIAAVEMEAAALYALASAKGYPIVCFAHVTNTMATAGDDFEKGADQGSQATLAILGEVARLWRGAVSEPNSP